MAIEHIIASIDAEILQLKQARAVLSGTTEKTDKAKPVRKRRKMSAAARKKIADAQRRRWAKQKTGK